MYKTDETNNQNLLNQVKLIKLCIFQILDPGRFKNIFSKYDKKGILKKGIGSLLQT